MKFINLVDNRRYFLESTKNKENGENEENKKYTLKKTEFEILKAFTISDSNKLDNKDFMLVNNPKDESFIFKYRNESGEEYVQTGNLIGRFYFKDKEQIKDKKQICEINIGLRFDGENSSDILEFLLDYSDSLYPKSIDNSSKEKKNSKDSNKVIEIILIKMFMNSVSKAIVMGLPTIYEEKYENNDNFRGRININDLIAKEMPFKGKVPHIKNEKVVVRNIASVILKTIEVINTRIITNFKLKYKKQQQKENNDELNEDLRKISSLFQIKSYIKQSIKPMVITKQVIQEALHHKILNHPSFYEYKNTLKLASLILDSFQEPKLDNIKGESFGYLCDVSKLWENFLVRFLNNNISDDWNIEYEPSDLRLFKNRPTNFSNNIANIIKPDIVIKHKRDKKVMVFDAKFKSSKWFNREDFYKTVSYISYHTTNGYDVILSGQIYPDTKLEEIDKNIGLFDTDVDFRFFGIDLEKFSKNYSGAEQDCKLINIINKKTNTE
jgi:5-methylcytosine-specific restriction endonuclease McrBC regulatory subunit McrC